MRDGRTTGQILRALQDRSGLSVRGFAKACGYSHASGIQRYIEEDFDGNLRPDVATKMAQALMGKGDPPIVDTEIYDLIGLPVSNATIQKFEGASTQRMMQDVPILGTALGADRIDEGLAIEQTELYTGDRIGFAKRPVILDGRADVYGIYTQGSSMEPVHMDGGLLLVEAKRPPRIGDDVLVYLRRNGSGDEGDDGASARTVLIKRLVRRSSSYVELRQFSPDITFKIAAKDVLQIHRVMTLADLLS